MDLSFMQNELVMALCWTLIHSLWQGLLLAAVTGAVMIGTRRSGADKRYRLLTFLFFAFVAVAAITFTREYKSIAQQNKLAEAVAIAADASGLTATPIVEVQQIPVQVTMLERFKDYFNTHASLIVLIWFVIFIARFIRLGANLVYIDRLRHYKTATPPTAWLDRFEELVAAIGLKSKTGLLESAIVKVPVAMGVFKPVILLPMGLLAHLPADEIEAILLHELAHIKRRDYLVNLLQNFAETIFFFNPALMWVSSMIREERENCCDDIAISVTNNKSNFINALIAFQEYNFSASRYTVGFPGSRNQLLNRVKRIVHEKNKTLNAAEKSLLTLGIGIFILFSFAAAKKIAPGIIKENGKTEGKEMITIESKLKVEPVAMALTKHAEEAPVSIDRTLIAEPGTREFLDPSSLLLLKQDTTPPKSKPLKLSGRTVFEFSADSQADSSSNLFTGISINRKAENNQDYVIAATAKTGTEYKIHKVDGVVKEMFVDGVQAGDPSAYQSVVDNVERAINYRQQQLNYRWSVNAAEQKRLIDLKRQEIQLKQHALDSTRKMQVKASWESPEMKLNQDMLDQLKDHVKQQSIKLQREDSARMYLRNKIDLQNSKITFEADSIRFDEKKKTFTLKGNAKVVNKNAKEKGGGYEIQADDIRYEVDAKKQKNAIFSKNEDTRAHAKMTIEKNQHTKILAKLTDSLHSLTAEKHRLSSLDKENKLKELMLEDEARIRRSARLMKDIIADIEKEGVKIDLSKSWFALDKSQFVVDGKAMPEEMHQKFIARYVTSHEGWGYYYGPVKTTGRGIFLDYASISR